MKKLTSMLLAVLIGCSFSLSTFAQNFNSDTGHDKEVVVEVESEEEATHYPRNPDYKYTFIISSLQSSRALCHQCGKPNMGLATVRTEWSRVGKSCPMNQFGPIDHFMTDKNYQVERQCH